MRMLDRLLGVPEKRDISTFDEYVSLLNEFTYGGIGYATGGVQQTLAGTTTERAPANFIGLAQHAYGANGVVFSCMLVRMLVFSSVRFRWQRLRDGKPSDTFGDRSLRIMERPWTGGTTQDLLTSTIQDADLAGNAYWVRNGLELVRLRPDWVDIVVGPSMMLAGRGQIGWRKLGYVYTAGGTGSGIDPVGLLADEVAHFAPIPDPLANFRGMSWLTPVLREIQADQAMTRHQRAFFDNGATVNMVIKHASGATEDKVKAWREKMEDRHTGSRNAYKDLHLYPGADATLVGSNLKDIDFRNVRGGGETRIAAASGVPPVIVGLSEGLQAATYSNYGQARRRLADGTAHPLWQNVSGCFEMVLPRPGDDTRLWYDPDDVPFLREDEKDAADIQKTRAETIGSLIISGYEPDSVVKAVSADDLRLLKHTGRLSVQLHDPNAPTPDPAAPPADAAPDTEEDSDEDSAA